MSMIDLLMLLSTRKPEYVSMSTTKLKMTTVDISDDKFIAGEGIVDGLPGYYLTLLDIGLNQWWSS